MARPNLTQLIDFLRSTARVLSMELRLLRWHGARTWLALEAVSSVLLALLLAELFDMDDRWWVAISAYVVMRADWHTSFSRALQRMAGTLGGAVLAALIAPWVVESMSLYALSLALVAGAGVYRALGSTRSYAWLLATVTALLVLADTLHDAQVHRIALLRVADVAVGTFASLSVAGLIQFGRKYVHLDGSSDAAAPLAPTTPANTIDRRDSAVRRLRAVHALQGAITIAVLAALDFHGHFRDFPQMLVTIAVVLVIPLDSLVRQEDNQHAVALRMANRTLGCLLAAACAFTLLPLIGDWPIAFLLCLSAGVWLAAHVQAGNPTTSYIGTQFGIAFLMVFVQDQLWTAQVGAAAVRLLGILCGVLSLGLVMLGFAWLRQRLSQKNA
ncbi:MAG: FUSC family protein [Dyella sp.]